MPTPLEEVLGVLEDPLLEQKYPAEARRVRELEELGVSREGIERSIQNEWNQLKSIGLSDAQISEMYQGRRPFLPALPSKPQGVSLQTLEQAQQALAPTPVEEKGDWLADVFNAAQVPVAMIEHFVKGLTAGEIDPTKLPGAASQRFQGAVGGLSEILGSVVGTAFLAGKTGTALKALGVTNRVANEALKWGTSVFLYDALNQLADKGQIDPRELSTNAGAATLLAGIFARLSPASRQKLVEKFGTPTAPARAPVPPTLTEEQVTHLEQAGKQVEKTLSGSPAAKETFEAAKLEAGESTVATPPKAPTPLVPLEVGERQALIDALKKAHPDVPEAQWASMSLIQLKNTRNFSYDPRQILGPISGLQRLGSDRGVLVLEGAGRWGVSLPGGGFINFESQEALIDWLSRRPVKPIAPAAKAVQDIMENNVTEATKTNVVLQKVHRQLGETDLTKVEPSGLGVRAVLAEGQLIKPYKLDAPAEVAKNLMREIERDGLKPIMVPTGKNTFHVLAGHPTDGRVQRAAHLYGKIQSLKSEPPPGTVYGLKPDDFVFLMEALGKPVNKAEIMMHVKAMPTHQEAMRQLGRKLGVEQAQALVAGLDAFWAARGVAPETAARYNKLLLKRIGGALADQRRLGVNLHPVLKRIDAERKGRGLPPIADELSGIISRTLPKIQTPEIPGPPRLSPEMKRSLAESLGLFDLPGGPGRGS